jgi:heme exporter protein A
VITADRPSLKATATQRPSLVRAVRLSKSIDERPVLRDIDFEIQAGSYVALLGANGAGKSTLLKIIATLIPPTTGELQLFGQPIRSSTLDARRKIGFIGHNSMLYRDLTAMENLEFYAKLYRLPNPATRARQMLAMAGLESRAGDAIKTFSRGMIQRAAIARALLHDPELLLADEPFSGLDAPSIASLEELLSDLNASGKTIILVIHDIEQSLRIAERAIILRGGRIVASDSTFRLYPREVLSEVTG